MVSAPDFGTQDPGFESHKDIGGIQLMTVWHLIAHLYHSFIVLIWLNVESKTPNRHH